MLYVITFVDSVSPRSIGGDKSRSTGLGNKPRLFIIKHVTRFRNFDELEHTQVVLGLLRGEWDL